MMAPDSISEVAKEGQKRPTARESAKIEGGDSHVVHGQAVSLLGEGVAVPLGDDILRCGARRETKAGRISHTQGAGGNLDMKNSFLR